MTVLVDPVAISKIAANSALARVEWGNAATGARDRGTAPIGYIKGMAVMFAVLQKRLAENEATAVAMASPVKDNDEDALSWYRQEFAKAGMSPPVTPIDTLRSLFVLMYGLGMRESSGKYCEGRDRTAKNPTSDSAEAGLFQMSWDAADLSPFIRRLFNKYEAENGGYKDIFAEDVTCSSKDLENYGSGEGNEFQNLSKLCPGFSVECAAVVMRVKGGKAGHWGPLRRKEAEVRPEADELLRLVQTATTGNQDSGGEVADADDEMAYSVTWLQWALNRLGATPPLDMDGVIGPATRGMVKRFQQETNLPATGLPDEATVAEIDRHLQRELAPPPMVANAPIATPPAGSLKPESKSLFGKLFGKA